MIFKIVDLKGNATYVVVAGIGDADPHAVVQMVFEQYMRLRAKRPDAERNDLLYDVKDWLYTQDFGQGSVEIWWQDEKHIDVINEM